jgi:hypothetical protein
MIFDDPNNDSSRSANSECHLREDVSGRDAAAVEAVVGVGALDKDGAVERDASKQT